MNNVEDLEASCATLQAQLDEHRAMIQALKDKPAKVRQRVRCGEYYWFINTRGCAHKAKEDRDFEDIYRFSIGNYYHVEQEAKAALDKQLATMRIFDKLRELEGDWEADWGDLEQNKYTYFVRSDNINTVFWCQNRSSNDLRWYSSKETIDWVFDNMMEDLKLAWNVSE